MKSVNSYAEFLNYLKGIDKVYLFLYKPKGSEQSVCALNNLSQLNSTNPEINLLVADVTKATDIHIQYNIKSVPTLLEFERGNLQNVIKGCHEPDFYNNIFHGNRVIGNNENTDKKPQKSVVVYSTPTCSWCTTIKNYFRDNHISFRDIDVSRNAKAAEEMVKRSGQQGVPQTAINGEVIIGFDKTRIDKLLGIQSK